MERYGEEVDNKVILNSRIMKAENQIILFPNYLAYLNSLANASGPVLMGKE